MIPLHVTTTGTGPDLVLLHGWGAHSAVWSLLRQRLNQHFRVTSIDLPGHGESAYNASAMTSLPVLARAVLEVAPAQASWLGWSLGGLVAQQAALLQPQRIAKLILVASTARFVSGNDWPHAVTADVFTDFYQQLSNDARASLLRFIALQTRGSQFAKDDAKQLKTLLLQPPPSAQALAAGLDILRDSDLRTELKNIRCPVCLLGGARDTLVPVEALTSMKNSLPDAHCTIIEKAGHAPFVSHAEQFLVTVNKFLNHKSDISNDE